MVYKETSFQNETRWDFTNNNDDWIRFNQQQWRLSWDFINKKGDYHGFYQQQSANEWDLINNNGKSQNGWFQGSILVKWMIRGFPMLGNFHLTSHNGDGIGILTNKKGDFMEL